MFGETVHCSHVRNVRPAFDLLSSTRTPLSVSSNNITVPSIYPSFTVESQVAFRITWLIIGHVQWVLLVCSCLHWRPIDADADWPWFCRPTIGQCGRRLTNYSSCAWWHWRVGYNHNVTSDHIARTCSHRDYFCRFTVAEWLTCSPATLEVTGSRPTFGGILEIYFSNRYSHRHRGT